MLDFVEHRGEKYQIYELVEIMPNEKIQFDDHDLNIADELLRDLHFESGIDDVMIRTNELSFFPFILWVVHRLNKKLDNQGKTNEEEGFDEI